jgi:cleavage and polyadenylation specificity factor subunit 2
MGIGCPVYATLPVHNMGQICLLEALKYKLDAGTFQFDKFGQSAVHDAFERIVHLR